MEDDQPPSQVMTVSDIPKLIELLSRAKYLLLDFDGPVCSVFAGRSSRSIAIELLDLLGAANAPVPASLDETGDPLEILRHVATVNTQLLASVERRLRAAEVDATQTATPTPHARELVNLWRQHGGRAAIVSNNASPAIAAYLAAREIDVDAVSGRTSPDPSLLKPSPHLVVEAMCALGADPDPDAYILVGDSVTDIIAAREAGIRSIGYANAHGKCRVLSDAGASIVVDNMATLCHAAAQR
jgi:beta-phosphoglucomutase-like phosphatase (HAD superfamily)